MFVVELQRRAWGGGWRIPGLFITTILREWKLTSPPGLSTSPSGKKKGARTYQHGKHPEKDPKCFQESLSFLLASQTNQNRGKPKVCQAAKSSFGNGATRARHPPTRYPRPADSTRTHPGQPRPLTAALDLTERSPTTHPGPSHVCHAAPSSLRPAPLTALTLGAVPRPLGRRLTSFPRPLPQPKPRVTSQQDRRAGEGGGVATARGGEQGPGGSKGGAVLSANHSGL